MKSRIPFLFLAPLAALATDAVPAVELEPVDRDPAWRVSVGFRAAPGIKTSAAVGARAAAAAAGGILRPDGRTGRSTSVSVERFDTPKTGTTEKDALSAAGWSGSQTRWDFDDGWIDLDDGANRPGETQNWHFDDASALADGEITVRRNFFAFSTTRVRTTTAETSRSVSLREEWGEDLRDSSDETACGVELRLDRTLWEDEDFGLDFGLGYARYTDADVFSIRGRAYSAVATTRTETRSRTVEFGAMSAEAGTVVTSISQPEFANRDDIRNADGSIGGGYVVGGTLPEGWKTPVLTVSEDRFSTTVQRMDPVAAWFFVGDPETSSSSRTTRRTVDVRSEGTLSLQELRAGVRPFWKATRRLSLRGDVGLLAVYSELETDTRISVDGTPAASIRRDDDDWTFGGYAGAALDLAATDALTFSLGAEARFPHKKLRFDDGVVSGSVELAEWSAFAAVAVRF